MRLRRLLILPFVLFGAMAEAQQPATPIAVTVQNGSERPVRCLLVFAHWTTMDLPVLWPGGSASVQLYRAPDRALFLPRPQDGRPMMLEGLQCGYDAGWADSLVRLDWTWPMFSQEVRFTVSCSPGARLSCRWR